MTTIVGERVGPCVKGGPRCGEGWVTMTN